ncbi:MAG: phosphatase PAP2 family protein, partial [Flavobacteriales bacterium]|nr:phosphatase PAP2 family protein [Flavobacteriales bacterium]
YRSGNDLVLYISIALFIAGLVAYARVKLRAHTPAQVYAGFGLGTMVNLVVQLMAE